YTPSYGAQFSIPVSYEFKDWLSVQSGVSYVQKNYGIVRTGFFEGIHQDNKNNYIQVPLMAHFSFGGKKLRGFLNLGGYGAYWASGTVQGTEPNILNPVDSSFTTSQQPANDFALNKPYSFNEKYSFDSRKDRRWEWGVLAGVGISYQVSPWVQVYMEGRYVQSLTDQQKNYMINQVGRYNQTFSVIAGALVPVKIFSKRK
ncbi:MAG TPA: porin family protein, partial [Puia sp.]|nr:porin family protein [Puia sp.]